VDSSTNPNDGKTAHPKSSWVTPADRERYRVFRLPAVRIDTKAKITTETRRQADLLFPELSKAGVFKTYKLHDKKKFFYALVHAAKLAKYRAGPVMFTRNERHPSWSVISQQVIDAAVEVGLFFEYRSEPQSKHWSRLVPTEKLVAFSSIDPWEVEPNTMTSFVYLRKRGGKGEELPFDRDDPVPSEVQRILGQVNTCNRRYHITCLRYDEAEGKIAKKDRMVIRPVHYALFSDNWDTHGRIYTGKYGHQGLRALQRQTIKFNDMPSIEYDYGGMHPRLLYHLRGIDYQGDPYLLWGERTSTSMRTLAKVFVNALINAKTPQAAISACNQKMSVWNKKGSRKKGKAREEAYRLRHACQETGVKFADMLPLTLYRHAAIRDDFGCDRGVELMRIDSQLALSILDHFSSRGIPCLSCHDSFTVPEFLGSELELYMSLVYRDKMGFSPIVK